MVCMSGRCSGRARMPGDDIAGKAAVLGQGSQT